MEVWGDSGRLVPSLKTTPLNWKIHRRPCYALHHGKAIAIDDHVALVRGDTKEVIGLVRDSYKPMQNQVILKLLEAAEKRELLQCEAAGVLRGGRSVWVMCSIPMEDLGHGVEVKAVLHSTNTNDGGCRLLPLMHVVGVGDCYFRIPGGKASGRAGVIDRRAPKSKNLTKAIKQVVSDAVAASVSINVLKSAKLKKRAWKKATSKALSGLRADVTIQNELGVLDTLYGRFGGSNRWDAFRAVALYTCYYVFSRTGQVGRFESLLLRRGYRSVQHAWNTLLTE